MFLNGLRQGEGFPKAVMGLDLSLTSAGICVIKKVGDEIVFDTSVCGYGLKDATDKEKIERLCTIQDEVKEMAVRHSVCAIGSEGMAFKGNGLGSLGEVFGAVKTHVLRELGLVIHSIPPRSARKYLLGEAPSASVKAKKAVRQFFEENCGLKVKKFDETDAACIASVMWDWMNRDRVKLPSRKLEVLMRIDEARGGYHERDQ